MRSAVHHGIPVVSYSGHKNPVLLYDARCSVCKRFVSLAVKADRRGLLRIAPLQGSHGEAVRREYPEFAAMDSALWISNSKPVGHSDAILSTLEYLGGPWEVLSQIGGLVPRRLRNWVYRTFAANRKYFGWLGLDELDARAKRRTLREEPSKGGSHGA